MVFTSEIKIKKFVCHVCMTILCAGLDVREVARDYATAVRDYITTSSLIPMILGTVCAE